MEFIRKTGNTAAHAEKKIKKEQTELCLENLYYFMDFVAYCYASDYTQGTFDREIIKELKVEPVVSVETELKLDQLMKENAALREELTAKREEQQQTYVQ